MGRKSELAVWAGVIKGLDECDQSDAPLVTLGDFLGRLRKRGWHPADVRIVEQCVLELLAWQKEQSAVQKKSDRALPPTPLSFAAGMPAGVLS